MSDSPLRKGSQVYFYPEGDPVYSEARVAWIEDISVNEQGTVANLAILSRGQMRYVEGIKHTNHLDLERHPHNRQRDGVFSEVSQATVPEKKAPRSIPLYDQTTPVFNDSPAATVPTQPKAPEEAPASPEEAPASLEELKAAILHVANQHEEWSSEQIFRSFRGTKGLTKVLVTEVLTEMQEVG
jgi:hypothetical protein